MTDKLNPNANGFSWPNARALAAYCALAYTARPTVFSLATDADVIVRELPDCIVVAFRGSKEAKDFIQDGKFEMESLLIPPGDSPAKVHKGFLEDFDSVNEDLVDTVKGLPAKPLFVTGHSLGGALAILCALEFLRTGFRLAGVYTFGQPRVGNGALARCYDAASHGTVDALHDITWRVVNQNDIVPRVPGALLGYRHCGNEVFLPVGGGWSLNAPWWTRALSDALGFWWAFRHRHDVLLGEHKLENYQDRMDGL